MQKKDPERQGPGRYIGEDPAKVDLSGPVGIERMPLTERERKLYESFKEKPSLLIKVDEYEQNKDGIQDTVKGLVSKGYIKPSITNAPKSHFWTFTRII
jgi:hypothetical protein